MDDFVSVIIPNYNGGRTIGKCLEAVFLSDYRDFEVIVIDDCSTDNSFEIVKKFPCALIRLERHYGASKARNTGARNSRGNLLFFIDSDCIMQEDTISAAVKTIAARKESVIGGTYTEIPYDHYNFFSTFQSIFIHYSETKKNEPDYIASHAMIIDAGLFKKSGGFPEEFLPILEDVEFSHRLRRSGSRLAMDSHILVRHIFNFNLIKSMKNAFRKSMFWTMYSMKNKDILKDSGTASLELKLNGACLFIGALSMLLFVLSRKGFLLSPVFLLFPLNLYASRGLIGAFFRTKGLFFGIAAMIYYMTLYPLAAGTGALVGALRYFTAAYRSPNPLSQGARTKMFSSIERKD